MRNLRRRQAIAPDNFDKADLAKALAGLFVCLGMDLGMFAYLAIFVYCIQQTDCRPGKCQWQSA